MHGLYQILMADDNDADLRLFFGAFHPEEACCMCLYAQAARWLLCLYSARLTLPIVPLSLCCSALACAAESYAAEGAKSTTIRAEYGPSAAVGDVCDEGSCVVVVVPPVHAAEMGATAAWRAPSVPCPGFAPLPPGHT